MHIQEIVVDGFKSYAHRTVIAGFDPHFNAITGLNGSGKSNILDAICFVLGITNLSHVRAGNLSELVYKQGQAGISKASVTVIFYNGDASSSPVGYESCPEVTVTRQVLIGGKSKYLINGRVSPANQVGNLFHSVQLNVNNPHFLIMQGRITKVLNMKPKEILGMVEEAAGTKMYEVKKIAALKTIAKKEIKVQEINSVLREEITPTLERLRGEKHNYLAWNQNEVQLQRLERFVIAHDYYQAETIVQKTEQNVETMETQLTDYQNQACTFHQEVESKQEEMNVLSSQLQNDVGQDHVKAKALEESLAKELVKATSAWSNSETNAKKAIKDSKVAQDLVLETKQAIQAKQSQMEGDAKEISLIHEEAHAAQEELTRLTTEYQSMCAGISSEESGGNSDSMTLPNQISKAHTDANGADAKAKQATMKILHLSKSIKSVEKDMKREEKSAEQLSAKKLTVSQRVSNLQQNLDSMEFSPTEYTTLETTKVELQNSLSSLHEQLDTLTAQLQGRLRFQYSDPVRGFDRSKVKGLVARLVTVKNSQHATALEVVAGGKLYQVVVDEAITGKALLSRGKLQRRVTLIPLDKITPRRVTHSAVQRASALAQDMNTTASPAIELVGFEEEVRNALEYVFGSSLVVDGTEAANRICDATRTRTVTLEGDVYDPSGTISGGSRNNLGTTLAKLTEVSCMSAKVKEEESRLAKVNANLEQMKSSSKKFDQFSDQLELARAELKAVEKHLSQTSYGMLMDKFTSMRKEVDDATEVAQTMEAERVAKWDLYNELKEKELELTRNREAKLKEVDQKVKEAKKICAAKNEKSRKVETQTQTLELELDSLTAELAAAEEAVLAAEQVSDEMSRIEGDHQMKVGDLKARYDDLKLELDDIEKKMDTCSSALKKLGKEKSAISKNAEAAELNAKKMSVQLSKLQKEASNSVKHIFALDKKYPWIQTEKESFGVEGGDYDFNVTDPVSESAKLKSLKSTQSSLEKKINRKVMGMIEKAEGEYNELLRKRKTVENDKKKIHSVIENLDVKKKSELERTWVKVNRDFGSIFSTLLPGASAKLEPPEGMHAWEGLEVKVAFGEVWKESLSELSGGQRSLLALSLILSLLLFKPAPMYILDEVDAALDLSHTQNIGNMLKTHFSQSQFIVVSLKEGMFNNANVIFRTKFVDGVSTVNRTIGIGASSKARALAEADDNNIETDQPSRKRAARGRSLRAVIGKEN